MGGNGNGKHILTFHSADERVKPPPPAPPPPEPLRTMTEPQWDRMVSSGFWLLIFVFFAGVIFGALTARIW